MRYTAPKVRVQLVREEPGAHRKRQVITCPQDAYEAVRDVFASMPHEVMAVLHLDTKGRLISVAHASEGLLTMTLAHPREVFRAAILANAASVILAHNHPSGDARPSPADLEVQRRLEAAGKVLDIEVMDGIVVGDDGYVSLRTWREVTT